MRPSHLRIYHGPGGETGGVDVTTATSARDSVTVPLMDILPLLGDAVRSERTWLRDFEDDEITISMDLYEVILAYQHYRRPSA
ncbi:MAG: hypothetical protein JW818_15035 [Pirellulales bacterium]|nr:hypothetical protein [Pirellulales bacterium]